MNRGKKMTVLPSTASASEPDVGQVDGAAALHQVLFVSRCEAQGVPLGHWAMAIGKHEHPILTQLVGP